MAGAVNKCDLWQMSDPLRAQDEAEDLNSRVGALRCHGATQGSAYCQRYSDQAFLFVAFEYSKKVHSRRKQERTLTRGVGTFGCHGATQAALAVSAAHVIMAHIITIQMTVGHLGCQQRLVLVLHPEQQRSSKCICSRRGAGCKAEIL